jgi:hypothetical protein
VPHAGADEYDFGNYVLAHSGEESLSGFDGSLSAYPEKADNAQIDLVDQGEVFVTFGVLDFVDSDGVNPTEHPMLQAPVTTGSTASKTLSQEVRNEDRSELQHGAKGGDGENYQDKQRHSEVAHCSWMEWENLPPGEQLVACTKSASQCHFDESPPRPGSLGRVVGAPPSAVRYAAIHGEVS